MCCDGSALGPAKRKQVYLCFVEFHFKLFPNLHPENESCYLSAVNIQCQLGNLCRTNKLFIIRPSIQYFKILFLGKQNPPMLPFIPLLIKGIFMKLAVQVYISITNNSNSTSPPTPPPHHLGQSKIGLDISQDELSEMTQLPHCVKVGFRNSFIM